jgi:putative nucleotidyltransferase with HDIG domain
MLPDLHPDRFQSLLELFSRLQLGYGFFALAAVLAALSFVVVYEWQPTMRNYVQGEVAETDIASPITFSFHDAEATRLQREAVEQAQPLICVLNLEPAERLHRRVTELFTSINRAQSPADIDTLRLALSDETGEEISTRLFSLLLDPEIQALAGNNVLPWLEQRMRAGMVSDSRALFSYTGGVIVRDLNSGEIISRMAASEVTDVRNAMLDLSVHVRNLPASAQTRRLLTSLFSGFITATLTPNFEATAQSAAEAAKMVSPVVQQIMADEVIVRQGERISQEQLAKLQALWVREAGKFKPELFFGVFLCAALLCAGFFYSSTGQKLPRFSQKELLFIASLLAFFTVLAKAFLLLGTALAASNPVISTVTQAFAVPVAGAAGLAVMVSASKRYFITCLLLALFCTLVNKGGLTLFVFYFMSSMLGAWLIIDIQTRKEMGKKLLMLLPGLALIWLASTLAQGGDAARFMPEFAAVLLGGLLSMTLIFALSPLIELIFGFTTRFALMELMNQEHPILRQMMFDAPGSYHHCLIVSAMVEVAAKAIGANSLLCKVGALYHDIGKVEKPQYFVENQFHIPNPHDKLAPTMSALVLISHVRRGVELAQKYRLGKEITDIIREHHGNRVMHYFYQKAVDQKALDQNQPGWQNVQLEDFCYDGPRPQSREAALVMLADVVEASSRTLDDPTPSRIKTHVHRMIRSVFADGQLNAVDMTFKDLEQVEDNFTLILIGMFHKRIEYPGKGQPKAEQHALIIGSEPATALPALPNAAPDATSDAATDVLTDSLPEDEYHVSKWLDSVEEYDDMMRKKIQRRSGQNTPGEQN